MDLSRGRRVSSVDARRSSTAGGLDPGTNFDYSPNNSPRLDDGRFSTTPRVAPPRTSGYPSHRKNSSAVPLSAAGTPLPDQGLLSSLYRGRQNSTLPGAGRRGLTGPTRLQILRGILLRPLYILSRRGPALPITGFVIFLLFYVTYSTNASSQSVKRRMQGAMKPYIPTRAAAAFSWKQMPLTGGGLGGAKVADTDVYRDRDKPKEPQGRKAQATLSKPWVLPEKRADGRVILVEGEKHPIPLLMLRARKEWEALKARQSKTFGEAVQEYVRRHGRRPPAGFDKWYAFAKAHNVLLIDEFNLIGQDLKMFHAFSPPTFRARVQTLLDTFDTTWIIRIEGAKAFREGQLENHDRAIGVMKLIVRFAQELPDMRIVYNGHDGARVAVADEERKRLENIAQIHAVDGGTAPFEPVERGPFPHHSVPVFCPEGSAVRAEGFDYGWPDIDSTGFEMPPIEPGTVGTIVEDFKNYMDVCNSPQYRHFHATTSWVYAHHPTPVLPLFTPGVQPHFGDIHSLIVEQLDFFQEHDPTWEERPFTSLQWRGQTSGPLWEAKTPWKTTHRARLHLLSHQETGDRKIVVTDEDDIMRIVEAPNYRLNPLFLDTGMIGPAVQCVEEDGTCAKMEETFQGYDKRISFDRASLYKYVLDVDGNSWSGRFRRLMMSNAAVVKTTIFPEFWTDWAIPWLHFIPMQVDYSDMWDILSFFRGGINGEGAHDSLGKEIAEAGKDWVKQSYRWADLETYQYRLMLEYGRLYNDETGPGSNDFNGDESVEPVWPGTVVL